MLSSVDLAQAAGSDGLTIYKKLFFASDVGTKEKLKLAFISFPFPYFPLERFYSNIERQPECYELL